MADHTDGAGEEGKYDHANREKLDVGADDRDSPKEVADGQKSEDPDDSSQGVVGSESAPRHPGDTGDHGGEGSNDGHKPRQQHCFGASLAKNVRALTAWEAAKNRDSFRANTRGP